MTVTIDIAKGANLRACVEIITAQYPDICKEEGYDGPIFYVGREEVVDDSGNILQKDDDGYENFQWLTYDEAVECVGFCEGVSADCICTIEGNGSWAMGELRKSQEYKKAYQEGFAKRPSTQK